MFFSHRDDAFGIVIGYWLLVIGSVAQQHIPEFSILNSPFSIKNLPTTHYPLLSDGHRRPLR